MGERDLRKLLATLRVYRHPGDYSFTTQSTPPDLAMAIMAFREREGWTSIRLSPDEAPPEGRWAWLEILTQSSLHAVGLTAAISTALTAAGIPCNVVAAANHDHIFVPASDSVSAMAAIMALQTEG
ncbi:MAG: ACT domain-containing protein [Hyphomonadaceae bacterium]|nr:ACT domain-containing protein [Hyphomonadaceae bacterium]